MKVYILFKHKEAFGVREMRIEDGIQYFPGKLITENEESINTARKYIPTDLQLFYPKPEDNPCIIEYYAKEPVKIKPLTLNIEEVNKQ